MEENLSAPLYWEASYEIVLALCEQHPHCVLEDLGIAELRNMIVALPQFADDPSLGSEATLRAIMCEWYEETESG